MRGNPPGVASNGTIGHQHPGPGCSGTVCGGSSILHEEDVQRRRQVT